MFDWRDQSVFVTGATGLLGSTLVAELLARGAKPVVLVRDWVPDSELVRSGGLGRCTVVRGELGDLELLVRALNEHEVASVFHLGAQTIVGTANRSPLSTFESNVRGTWNLLEAAMRAGGLVRRIVVASSDKAYGEHDRLPYTEDAPLQGRFPYDVSKSCADLISISYARSYGLPVAITRCGNLFGGGDLNFNRLIPGTIVSALRGERPVIRSDGRYIRDYFYVRDAAEAYLRLAEAMPHVDVCGRAFNFGNEEPLDVLQVVGRILALMGRTELQPMILNEASREIRRQYLDCRRARDVLGWRPRFSLDEGLIAAIDWYRDHLDTGTAS
ncbi:MAG: GDP-mannose 4,6-dehydratase [Planctomycetes bacterium]|nr:GDP-mannose 4,6-dehydratase [Planctomycetota bacterium]